MLIKCKKKNLTNTFWKKVDHQMWSNKTARVMVNRRDHTVLEAGLSQYKLDTRNQENAKYIFILWGKKYRGGLHICLISKWSFIQSCEEIQIPSALHLL